jgi:hypothetical protein
MKTSAILVLAYIFILCSCEQVNVKPSPSIFNSWEEITPPSDLMFEGTSITSLNFKSDSSYQLVYHKWNDALHVGDPCMRVSTYYVKGNFSSRSDYMSFTGCYSSESFHDCIARCDGIMDRIEGYRFIFTGDTLKLMPEDATGYPRILVHTK